MVGEDALLSAERIMVDILKLAIEIARCARGKQAKHPKIKIKTGEYALKKLVRSGEDMVAIPEALKKDEIKKFSDLADDMGILYSVVELEGENILFVRKNDLDRAELCLNKIFKMQALESVKEKTLKSGDVTEQEWEQAVSLFNADELHTLNQEGLTFEDALDHMTDRDYSRDNTYYLFDRNNPDLYIKMKSDKAVDHHNKEYTKTTYSVYYKDELIGQVDDGRFPEREKNHWYNLKSQMKNTFGRGDVPDFSDNVFLLYDENDLNKFRDTYNKQLACIEDNQNKRLGKEELEGLKQAISDHLIPLLQDQDPDLKDRMEDILDKIVEIQDHINELKQEAFEYVGEKRGDESKEEFRDRMESLNKVQDAVKEQERELVELYANKDKMLSQMENIIGRSMETEAYANMIENIKKQGREIVTTERQNENKTIVTQNIVVSQVHAVKMNRMLIQEGKEIEYFQQREDGNVILNTDSYSNKERFEMLREKLEKVIENDNIRNLYNVFEKDLSAEESKAIVDGYAERVCEKIKEGSNIGRAIEQISYRECFNGKAVNLVDSKKSENFISIKTIQNTDTNQLDMIYSVSIDGKVIDYSNMKEVIEAVDGKIEDYEIECIENAEIIEKSDHGGRDNHKENKIDAPELDELER